MKTFLPFPFFLFVLLCLGWANQLGGAENGLPAALREWENWVLWGEEGWDCPIPYNAAQRPNPPWCQWPSVLVIEADGGGALFRLETQTFAECWVQLPGGGEDWPVEVRVGEQPAPVVGHAGGAAVKLPAGIHRLSGKFQWREMPEKLSVPPTTGLLHLTVNGRIVEEPSWDAAGQLWLKRARHEERDKDFLSIRIFRLIEDGIPMWLRTQIELSVAGKGREETIGSILPEGWILSSVDSPIPVAIDETGFLKVQVRAGQWQILLDAFQLNPIEGFRFPEGRSSPVHEELIAFSTRPDLRIAEIEGLSPVDASQTTFPNKWSRHPVYRWETASPFRIVEKMRGMGSQKPGTLSLERHLWLDEDGRYFTVREIWRGQRQEVWRLDAAANRTLGSVTVNGTGQLITRNPSSQREGVELRSRDFTVEAQSRLALAASLPAVGWENTADRLEVKFHLPPGWRLLALWGAEYSNGDWLTAWTLLDLFLTLIFGLAMYRLWGWRVGLAALATYGLCYHEPNALRYAWLVWLVPIALSKVAPPGRLSRLVALWQWGAAATVFLLLIPFVSRQLQEAIFPQLEAMREGVIFNALSGRDPESDLGLPIQLQEDARLGDEDAVVKYETREDWKSAAAYNSFSSLRKSPSRLESTAQHNLAQVADARIQTGPGLPEWRWRMVSCGWNSPVLPEAGMHIVLLPPAVQRLLSLARPLAVIWMAAFLAGVRRIPRCGRGMTNAVIITGLAVAWVPNEAGASLPDQSMLDALRERLLKMDDAFPEAAGIPRASLRLDEDVLYMEVEIETAARTAVPLPGRLPAWSPVSIEVNNRPEAAVRRQDGYLWVALEKGLHRVKVQGRLAAATEWEWSFLLKPRKVDIEAPGWLVTGIKPSGEPVGQVFFVREQPRRSGEAAYDRKDFTAVAMVERHLELGLRWQVLTRLRRLSTTGKAISLSLPLLADERVLTPGYRVEKGRLEVSLEAQQNEMEWESELAPRDRLVLEAESPSTWVEQWRLTVSPVWNVSLAGFAPVFEESQSELVPAWHPWPGETVLLEISRPEAVPGETVTIKRIEHSMRLGRGQRVSSLRLSAISSLGEDLPVEIGPQAMVTSLRIGTQMTPVRQEGGKIILPIRPGSQDVFLEWKAPIALGLRSLGDRVHLPYESANVHTNMEVPQDRWILWTSGPQLGPAVRFWVVLAAALLLAWVLGSVAISPLSRGAWMLLALGLTQVPPPVAMLVVLWLLVLAWRGQEQVAEKWSRRRFNSLQIVVVSLTVLVLPILLVVVSRGLLGSPDMFVAGNRSIRGSLNWYLARGEGTLPQPMVVTVSVWYYRLLMLAWALWLAASLLTWLKMGWRNFGHGGYWRGRSSPPQTPDSPLAQQPSQSEGL